MAGFRDRLKRWQQREYDRSNAVTALPVRATPRLKQAAVLLRTALEAEDPTRVERVAQVICDELCAAFRVTPVRVRVRGVRPANRRGELHGLYTWAEGSGPGRIELWMRTAKRAQVVRYRTFLRTLLHEVCHHLDYHLLHLRESFHTEGFFKRESSLVHQVRPADAAVETGSA